MVVVIEGLEVVWLLGEKFLIIFFVEKLFCSMICLYFFVDFLFVNEFILFFNGIKNGIINNMFFFIIVVLLYVFVGKIFVLVFFLGFYENIFDLELEGIVWVEFCLWFGF